MKSKAQLQRDLSAVSAIKQMAEWARADLSLDVAEKIDVKQSADAKVQRLEDILQQTQEQILESLDSGRALNPAHHRISVQLFARIQTDLVEGRLDVQSAESVMHEAMQQLAQQQAKVEALGHLCKGIHHQIKSAAELHTYQQIEDLFIGSSWGKNVREGTYAA